MSEILSQINPNSPEFKANYAHNKALADTLNQRQQQVANDRPARLLQRNRERGKLLVH